MQHHETHKLHRIGWLRAAVLGANDGIVSTASLIIGVAAAHTAHSEIILIGLAALVAGAMSMAAGEYVSVSSQADTENADLEVERKAIEEYYEHELEELADIYQNRGVDKTLSLEVAKQLMAHDSLGAHARDELGIFEHVKARPVQAALSSAAAFTVGALLPLLTVWFSPAEQVIPYVAGLSLVFLGSLGAVAAHSGGASLLVGAARVTFWGAAAMALTALVGSAFGVSM